MHAERIRRIHDAPVRDGAYVLYWCQMFRRLNHNHALDYALKQADALGKPLVIYEGLKLNYPWANARFHTFMLEGMRDNAAAAAKLGVSYWPFVETARHSGRGLVRKLCQNAAMLITDDYPAYIVPAQNRAVADVSCPVDAVDSNSVVPLSLLGARVGAAAHIRPRIHKLFPEWWPKRAKAFHQTRDQKPLKAPFLTWDIPDDIPQFVATLPLNQTVPPLEMTGGSVEGKKRISAFIKKKLPRYAEGRNGPDDPDANAASGLSPWLHYGHISIEEVVADILKTVPDWSVETINRKTRNKDDYYCRDANINSFLDEAITWRDLGYHWHYTRNVEVTTAKHVSWEVGDQPEFNFATMDFSPRKASTLEYVLPEWAWKSLSKHANDRREYTYTLQELETSKTHDELWNAAQTELVKTGKIHNYLRMLWAKKVLEWTASPDEAYEILEHFNNKYAIDGRDPNSYTGILWCFGLFDRPWAPERDVFGVIRYMSSGNTAKKFKLQGYYDYIQSLG